MRKTDITRNRNQIHSPIIFRFTFFIMYCLDIFISDRIGMYISIREELKSLTGNEWINKYG